MKKLAFLFLTAAALTGCETTVDLPEPPHTPRLALRYMLTTTPQDSSFDELFQGRQLYVSNSQHVFSTAELAGRTDATVELRDAAGRVVERYRPLASSGSQGGYPGYPGFYRPVLGFRPQVGQAYTLRASLPGLEPAESTLTMPTPAAVESGAYVPRNNPNTGSNQYQGRLSLTLRDDPATANYYLAFARVLDRQGHSGSWTPLDVDFNSQSSSVNIAQFQLSSPQQSYTVYPFADTGLNGQRISLTTDVNFYSTCYPTPGGPPCPDPGFIEVTVSSITADAYNFYLSRRRYYDSNDNPLAEPAPLASNVRPGYGLFGGSTDVTYRIALP